MSFYHRDAAQERVNKEKEAGFNIKKYPFAAKLFIAVIFFFSAANIACAQKTFRGMVLNEEDNIPIAFASVGVMGMEVGSISDSAGTFRVSLPANVRGIDTILFTSIGFSPLKIAVKEALLKKMFQLHPTNDLLPSVLVHNFRKNTVMSTDTSNNSFYRGWYEYRTGGEIGRIIKVLHKQYKLNRIAFQVDNKCDTCWLRLRVRKVVDFEPAGDLLNQSVIIPITRHAANEGMLEFDIEDLGIILKEKKVYIGFEVIDCKNNDGQPLSLCFIGSEYGDHFFRKYPTVKWISEDAYGLYLKMFFDY